MKRYEYKIIDGIVKLRQQFRGTNCHVNLKSNMLFCAGRPFEKIANFIIQNKYMDERLIKEVYLLCKIYAQDKNKDKLCITEDMIKEKVDR